MCGLFPRENPGLKPIQNRWTSFRGLKALLPTPLLPSLKRIAPLPG